MKEITKGIWEEVKRITDILYKDETRIKVYEALIEKEDYPEYCCYDSLDTMTIGDYDYITINKKSIGILAHDDYNVMEIPFELFDMREEEIVNWIIEKEIQSIELRKKQDEEFKEGRIKDLERQLKLLKGE